MKEIKVGKYYSLTERNANFISKKCCIILDDLLVLTTPKKCIIMELCSRGERKVYEIKFVGQRHNWLYTEDIINFFELRQDLKQEELEV